MGTRVVTDSSACLDPRLARHLGVGVVPIGLVFEDGTEASDDAVPLRRVRSALTRGESVKSVSPSVLDYLVAVDAGPGPGAGASEPAPPDRAVQEGADRGCGLILTPATEFTVMWGTARQAASLARRRVRVVDTRTAASAQGLVVEEVARRAAAGAGLEELEAAALDLAGRARLVAALGSLDTLGERGLVPASSVEAGRRAGARPVFSFRDGTVAVLGDAGDGSPGEVVAALVGQWRAGGGAEGVRTTVFHAGSLGPAREVAAAVGAPSPRRFSPAMTLHTGLGLVGVAWLAPPGA